MSHPPSNNSNTKLTSPPSIATDEAAATAVVINPNVGVGSQRKRYNGSCTTSTAATDCKCDANIDERCILRTAASTDTTIVRVGGWRLRVRDLLLAIAFAGGMLTIGLLPSYHQHNTHHNTSHHHDKDHHHEKDHHHAKSKIAYTASHNVRFDDSDNDSENTLGGDTASVLRFAAIESLDDQLEMLRSHDVRRSINGELNTTLRVGVAHFISGPISFWTRAYDQGFPGPLWSVRPGDTINLELINKLEPNVVGNWAPNTYHSPNSTNLHVHGMHVDPTGNTDNVMREAKPGETLVSQIIVPKNHPRGLYHYHPHYHGSIFLQLAGGMAGPILVEDNDATLPDEYKHMKNHILVLQEVSFEDLRDINKAARSTLNHRAEYTTKTLLDAQVRRLYPNVHLSSNHLSLPLSSALRAQTKKHFTPHNSRFFTVNGQFLPKIEVQPRENVRLRLLNAGGSAILELSVPGCTLRQIAADGIYFSTPPRSTDVLLLTPGARADVVINCAPNGPTNGPAGESLRPLQSIKHNHLAHFVGPASDVFHGILAFVRVSGVSRNMPVVTTTPPAPELYANGDLRVLAPQENAKLAPFPFVFSMDHTRVLKDGFPYKQFFINHAQFNMSSLREMPLDNVQEWVVVNERDEPKGDGQPGRLTASNHPFHIHTNAFQIIAMSHGEGVDYTVGDWRDVIAVPTPGNVTIRFRPVDFRGPTVAHCHAAAHSDAGMVALVQIV